MSTTSVNIFVKHIINSEKFREKYSAGTLLDFFNYTNEKKFTVPYNMRLSCMLDDISHNDSQFSKEFHNDLLGELAQLKNKKKDDKIIKDALDMMWYMCHPHMGMTNYFNNLANKYNIESDEILVHRRSGTIRKLWSLMDNNERSLWIKPSNHGNPYTKWISIHKQLVLEVYPNTNEKELYRIMGPIWTSMKNNIRYAQLREYTNYAPYRKYTEDEKNDAFRINRTMVQVLMCNHKRALETMKKYIRMKRFIKLCNSDAFNKYFWNPINMGGKWHINKMKKMCSEL
jgi:hypothetical protein